MDRLQHLLAAMMNPIVTMITMAGGVIAEDAVRTIITSEDIDEGEAGHRHPDDVRRVMRRNITATDAGRNETIHDHQAQIAV